MQVRYGCQDGSQFDTDGDGLGDSVTIDIRSVSQLKEASKMYMSQVSVEQGVVPLAPATSVSDHSLRGAIQVIQTSGWLVLTGILLAVSYLGFPRPPDCWKSPATGRGSTPARSTSATTSWRPVTRCSGRRTGPGQHSRYSAKMTDTLSGRTGPHA